MGIAQELPAVGDDRKGGASALLRLAEMPQFADKSGLVMQLKVAANLLLRADEVIDRYRKDEEEIDRIVNDCVSRSPPRDPTQTPVGRLRTALGMDGGSIGEVIEEAIRRISSTVQE